MPADAERARTFGEMGWKLQSFELCQWSQSDEISPVIRVVDETLIRVAK